MYSNNILSVNLSKKLFSNNIIHYYIQINHWPSSTITLNELNILHHNNVTAGDCIATIKTYDNTSSPTLNIDEDGKIIFFNKRNSNKYVDGDLFLILRKESRKTEVNTTPPKINQEKERPKTKRELLLERINQRNSEAIQLYHINQELKVRLKQIEEEKKAEEEFRQKAYYITNIITSLAKHKTTQERIKVAQKLRTISKKEDITRSLKNYIRTIEDINISAKKSNKQREAEIENLINNYIKRLEEKTRLKETVEFKQKVPLLANIIISLAKHKATQEKERLEKDFRNRIFNVIYDDFTQKINIIDSYKYYIYDKFRLSFQVRDDSCVLVIYSRKINFNISDTIQLLFENGEILEFIISTPPIKTNEKSEVFITIPLTKDELFKFAILKLQKYKLNLKGYESIIGNYEHNGPYPSLENHVIEFLEYISEYNNIKFISSESTKKQENGYTQENSACSVYLMVDNKNDCYKIGISNNPKYREHTLQSEKPFIELIKAKEFPNRKIAEAFEKALHQTYAEKRIRGEWFELEDNEVEDIKLALK